MQRLCGGLMNIALSGAFSEKLGRVGKVTCVLRVNLRVAQPLNRSLGGQGRVIDLFEGVGACLGAQDRQDLDVPMVILVECLPVAEAFGTISTDGGGLQEEVKFVSNESAALQRATQQCAQVAQRAWSGRRAFE